MLNLRAFEIKRPTSRAVWWFRSTGVGEEEEEEVVEEEVELAPQ